MSRSEIGSDSVKTAQGTFFNWIPVWWMQAQDALKRKDVQGYFVFIGLIAAVIAASNN